MTLYRFYVDQADGIVFACKKTYIQGSFYGYMAIRCSSYHEVVLREYMNVNLYPCRRKDLIKLTRKTRIEFVKIIFEKLT